MHKLHLPRLGQTMERGLIRAWLRSEGDAFEVGHVLYEVETEKVTVEVEAKLPGVLARIVASRDEELPVGALLAVVADPGETLSEAQIAAAIAEEAVSPAPEPEPAPAAAAAAASAAARGRPAGRVRATPRARSVARTLGIDLSTLAGTGAGGTVTFEDVQAASVATGGRPSVRERRPVRGIARTMAEVVTRSWTDVPQFVQQIWVDASAQVARRGSESATVKDAHGVDLSYSDLLIEAVVRAVQEVPEANASFAGDEIVVYEDANVSVAVATDAGLVVPVIQRAQTLSLGEIAVRLRELAERARTGALERSDVEGGTITVSNLGMFGVETGMPLVTAPQAAVVFAGAITDRPVAAAGSVEIRPVLGLAIGFDHRVLDGATAARFTSSLKRILESG